MGYYHRCDCGKVHSFGDDEEPICPDRNPDQGELFAQTVDSLSAEERFDGKTYEPPLDAERLGKQAKAVYTSMLDGRWHTLADLHARTGYPEASISARLRDFRKRKFGSHRVERERTDGGLFFYRLKREDA